MISRIISIAFILIVAVSCRRDHKKETISNYAQYIWKRLPEEVDIKKMEDVKSITGKDSVDLLIKEYAEGVAPLPSFDTVINRIAKDITYNSNFLAKINISLDSMKSFQSKAGTNDEFIKASIKSLTETKNFTSQQIDELKLYRNSFKKYSEKKDEVFCYEVLCQYKLKNKKDTTTRLVIQTFFLSPDQRKIYLVK
jgi:hypothetical protein